MTELIQNAQIGGTSLGVKDHGILTFYIHCEGDGWGQSFGGYGLDSYNREKECRTGWADGLMLIRDILEALEVKDWEKLRGNFCRIKQDSEEWNSQIIAIGHPVKDQWADVRKYTQAIKAEMLK